MPPTLSSKDLATFDALVDTLLPAVAGDGPAWTVPGSQLGLTDRLPEVFERLPHVQDQKDLRLFLRLLRTRAGAISLYGRPTGFDRLPPHQRADAIRRIEGHPVSLMRGGIRALKTLVALLWVTTRDPAMPPPVWEAMGYPGPDGPAPPVPKPIEVSPVTSDTDLTCDVVIVGSGAGGGTAAGVLAAAGLDVVVLEAGSYLNDADFTHLEADAYARMYLDGALNSTADGGVIVLAGSTLGGGTVINYTTSFPTPTSIREEWDRVSGFDDVFTGDDYAASVEAVSSRFGVNTDHGWASTRAQLMEKGLRDLGWHVHEMPRNARGCTEKDCGYCTMGCRIGAKQSTLLTYLRDAADVGARIVTGARVDSVLTENGRATGVTATVNGARLNVRARAVVLAAGALHTPAILLRSGLGGKATGRYLRLHPVTAVWARFAQRVEPWTGILQTRYSDEFADLDGEGYGFKFETAPIHPLFPAAFIGWEDGASFKRDVIGLAHLDVGGILLRDKGHGRVEVRKDGTPVWKYALSKIDQRHAREGVKRAAQMYAAAGAEEILTSTTRPVRWRPGSGSDLDEFVAGVDAIGYGSNQTTYFTFHQMGSARMGSDPDDSVVGPDNQAHDVPGLYVMDGSCFPTSSGVNPMLSIASIAHRGATLLAADLV
ncbi:MAG TPA: GMC family oxidoreductase [Acidimicrobiia bacterium]|nr:GMC family oxidoreductase [Acidimicrobiia bacterium]